ncbi:IS110 family transposase [Acidobacteria bacterium AH-259-D05]|nr:IS110 family transposase [Acidobacteria bacterium AH-259-D05]
MNCIGLDLHCHTIEMSVVREGKEIFKLKVLTEEHRLREAISSLKGPKRVVVEEGLLADWCKRVLEPLVNEFVICDPRRNRLVSEAEDKDDPVDAYRLALLLWMGQLKAVYHGDVVLQKLKEAVMSYWQTSWDLTRAKNRLKNQWTRRGIRTGRELYRESGYAQWREKLEAAWGPTELADSSFAQVSFLRHQKARRLKWLRQQARGYGKKMGWLQTIPGVGFIVAVTLVAFLGDPGRFPNKRKLWKYCGLGLRYRKSAGKYQGRRRRSREYNRMLKGVLGIAAQAARRSQDNELALYGAYRQAQGKSPSIVRRDLSRKIAVIAWSLLKKDQAYQEPGGRACRT